MITGQKPIKKSKQGRFQILDVVDMMRPITKYTHQLASADNIPSRVREAFRLAEEEKPGAVHLELPEDIADEQTDSTPLPRSLVRRPARRREGGPRGGRSASRRARSPLLVIGAGANRKMTSRMLLPADREDRHPVRHDPAGQGRGRRDSPEIPRLRGALGRRLRAPRDRGCRPHHQRRPRRDREAAVLHAAQGGARGDPRQLPRRPRSTRSISRRSR